MVPFSALSLSGNVFIEVRDLETDMKMVAGTHEISKIKQIYQQQLMQISKLNNQQLQKLHQKLNVISSDMVYLKKALVEELILDGISKITF